MKIQSFCHCPIVYFCHKSDDHMYASMFLGSFFCSICLSILVSVLHCFNYFYFLVINLEFVQILTNNFNKPQFSWILWIHQVFLTAPPTFPLAISSPGSKSLPSYLCCKLLKLIWSYRTLVAF